MRPVSNSPSNATSTGSASSFLEMSGLAERALSDCVEALTRRQPPAGLRRHPARPAHRREGEGDRPALPRVPRAAAARRHPPPTRLQRHQDRPRAGEGRRLRREHRPADPSDTATSRGPRAAPAGGSSRNRTDIAIPMIHDAIQAFVEQERRARENGRRTRAGRRRAPRQARHGARRAVAATFRKCSWHFNDRTPVRARSGPGTERVHGDALHVHGRDSQAPRRGLTSSFVRRARPARARWREAIAHALGRLPV